jgi:hypothetical protein
MQARCLLEACTEAALLARAGLTLFVQTFGDLVNFNLPLIVPVGRIRGVVVIADMGPR